MPQVEVRTRLRPFGSKRKGCAGVAPAQADAELIMELLLTPRGSGNRKWAVALAKAAKNHPQLGPHVKRVKAGSSKVWIYLVPSVSLAQTMLLINREPRQMADVPGQLGLFGVPTV